MSDEAVAPDPNVAEPAHDEPPRDATVTPEDWQPPSREQVESMEKAIAAANKRAKQLESAQAKRETDEAREAGKFEELYAGERQRAEQLEQGIKQSAIQSTVIAAAQRLGFRNPTLAANLITLNDVDASLGENFTAQVDQAGQAAIERRLTEVLAADPYLKGEPARAQLAGAGDSPANAGDGVRALNDAIRQNVRR